MRWDEPLIILSIHGGCDEFPACAGMNRKVSITVRVGTRVPRMRGDEPIPKMLVFHVLKSSPHARG